MLNTLKDWKEVERELERTGRSSCLFIE